MSPLSDNGVTVRELKDWLADLPDTDPVTGEPSEVWVEVDRHKSCPVKQVWSLNRADVLLEHLGKVVS